MDPCLSIPGTVIRIRMSFQGFSQCLPSNSTVYQFLMTADRGQNGGPSSPSAPTRWYVPSDIIVSTRLFQRGAGLQQAPPKGPSRKILSRFKIPFQHPQGLSTRDFLGWINPPPDRIKCHEIVRYSHRSASRVGSYFKAG